MCHKAIIPYDMCAVSYHMLGVTYSTLLGTKASANEAHWDNLVLPIEYAHFHDNVT